MSLNLSEDEFMANIVDLAEIYCPNIQWLQAQSTGITYEFLFLEPDSDAIQKDVAQDVIAKMRFGYTLGILERCHLACIVSLARAERWLSGSKVAIEQGNLMLFSASLRGLLEAAADAHDVLRYLPNNLAKMYQYSYLVLRNSADIDNFFVGFGALEDRLIHFAYAQRQPKGVVSPLHHTPKSNADYIKAFEQFDVPGLSALYSELCQLTHPAAPTVSCFMDETSSSLRLNFARDVEIISELLQRYDETIEKLVMFSCNPALMGLSVLSRLLPQWPAPSDASLSTIGNWSAVLNELDEFVQTYQPGSVDRSSVMASLQNNAIGSKKNATFFSLQPD